MAHRSRYETEIAGWPPFHLSPTLSNDYLTALLAALNEYGKGLDAKGELLVKSIQELLAKGVPVSKAVEMAIKQGNYTDTIAAGIANSVYKMALNGYGIPTSIRVDATTKDKITKTLTKVPWSSDSMDLSARLHGTENIVSTIQTSLKDRRG